jgi:hypothetical protein
LPTAARSNARRNAVHGNENENENENEYEYE